MMKLKIQSELYGNIQINILIRKRDDYWEVQVRLIDNGYDTILDTDGCQVGDLTTFQSVAVPELSEEGLCFLKLIFFELLSSVKLIS